MMSNKEKIDEMRKHQEQRKKELYQIIDKLGFKCTAVVALKNDIRWYDGYIKWAEENWEI